MQKKEKKKKQAEKCAARSHHTGWFGEQFPQVLAVS
jgi:phage terminase large subunit-like protein